MITGQSSIVLVEVQVLPVKVQKQPISDICCYRFGIDSNI